MGRVVARVAPAMSMWSTLPTSRQADIEQLDPRRRIRRRGFSFAPAAPARRRGFKYFESTLWILGLEAPPVGSARAYAGHGWGRHPLP